MLFSKRIEFESGGGGKWQLLGIIHVCPLAHEDSETSRALPIPQFGEVKEKNQLKVISQALGIGHVDDKSLIYWLPI